MRYVFPVEPADGQRRIVKVYTLIPLILINSSTGLEEMRWFETAYVEERYHRYAGGKWVKHAFTNEDMYNKYLRATKL